MKQFLFVMLIYSMGILSGCIICSIITISEVIDKAPDKTTGSPFRVEQELTGWFDGAAMVTYVWYKDKIMQSWYDAERGMPDSLPSYRRKQADSIIKRYKKVLAQ